jgi:hypothetical protein
MTDPTRPSDTETSTAKTSSENLLSFHKTPILTLWQRFLNRRQDLFTQLTTSLRGQVAKDVETEHELELASAAFVQAWLECKGQRNSAGTAFVSLLDALNYGMRALMGPSVVAKKNFDYVVTQSRKAELASILRKTPVGAIRSDIQSELIRLLSEESKTSSVFETSAVLDATNALAVSTLHQTSKD